jgi:hypothetical protein
VYSPGVRLLLTPVLTLLALPALGDNTNKQGLEQLRPLAERSVHRVKLSSPSGGRWKASEDVTRHDSKGAGAVFAPDLLRIDAEGDRGK